MSNVKTVEALYEAFGRGDIPAILERLSDDIDWEYAYPAIEDVPWLRRRRGRAEVGAFFASLGELEFKSFAPTAILDAPNGVVVVLVEAELLVKKTGRKIVESPEIHLWHFDAHGRVFRFRHVVDTLQHATAWR